MTRHEAALGQLKSSGYRLTPQRVMVLSAIAEREGHLGVEEIFERVRRVYPFVDVATVYRTLQLLVKLHLVMAIDSPTGTRYELLRVGERHHHMVCEECGEALDLPPQYLDALKAKLLREVGFEPHLEHLTIQGMCARCLEKGDAGRAVAAP